MGIERSVERLLAGADLSTTPAEATPDRALVFEVIGPVAKFVEAARSAGFEWLGEEMSSPQGVHDAEEEDEDSEYTEDEERSPTPLYVTMPTLAGLRKLLTLWKLFSSDSPPPEGAKDWWALFGYLKDLRT